MDFFFIFFLDPVQIQRENCILISFNSVGVERLPCPHQLLMSGIWMSLCRLMFLEFWSNGLNCLWWAMTWRGHAPAALNNYYLLWFEIYEFQTSQMCAVSPLLIRHYSILGHMTLVHSIIIIVIFILKKIINYKTFYF